MSNNKQSANLVAALEYIKRGWKIFPLFYVLKTGKCSCGWKDCKRVGKHPITQNGLFNATNDEAQVKQWWTESPYANIGLATGHNGLIVVDVDAGIEKKTGKPKVGMQSWQTLQEKHELVPDTLRAKTGGGGFHYYFLSVREIKNSSNKLGLHLDVRGHGGYVILPPSNHETGGKYAWDSSIDTVIADMPEWLEKVLMNEDKKESIDVSEDFDPIQDAKIAKASRADKFSPDQLVKLLKFIPADCDRDTWWQVGAALKKELGDVKGWNAWEAWSKTAPEAYDPKTALTQWTSFTDKGISGGTIYHFAQENGFRGFDAEAADKPEIRDKWVYAVSIKRFVETQQFLELDKEQFDATYSPMFNRGAPSQHALKSDAFKRVHGVTYWPQHPLLVQEDGQEKLNYWRRSNVTPAPGDVTLLLRHVEYLFPGDRPKNAKPQEIHIAQEGHILLDYLAFQVRRPGEKVHWAILLEGDQGTGKSFFIHVMELILGEHNVKIIHNDQLHDNFTEWQRNTQFICVEEMMAKKRLDLMNKLKPMITEKWCIIREMYRPAYKQPNRFNFLFLSNHKDSLIIDNTDRRYCILKTKAKPHPLRNAYYAPLFEWMRKNGPGIADHLLNRDLSKFEAKAHAPMTEGKMELIKESMCPIDQFIYEAVKAKEYPCQWDLLTANVLVKSLNDHNIRATPKEIGKSFARLGFLNLGEQYVATNTLRIWAVRDFENYQEMTSAQVRDEWSMQIRNAPSDPALTIDPMAALVSEQPKHLLQDKKPM